ncbi:MAG: Gfo/Idh/MocA family oxidoreductase, partial [Clostridia bacterium]
REFKLSDNCLFTNYDDFLNSDMDIVVLGTPIPNHAEEVIRALSLDKHVLCEVTAADNIKDCERIVEAVRASKGKYMMAENCIYMDFCMEWKKHIDKGRIGRPVYAEADYVHEIRDRVTSKWRANRAPLHYCSHSLGPVLHWMDDYVVRATALGSKSTMLTPATSGNIDIQVALFETKKGASIKVLRSSVALRHPALCTYSIYGDKGFLESGRTGYDGVGRRYFSELDPTDGYPIAVNTSDIDAPKVAQLGGHGSSEYYLVRDFLKAIDADATPPIDVVRAM